MISEKTLINNIIVIKKAIGEVVRDRLYIKNFSNKVIELLYELDDYSAKIGVDVIQKTELHKCLRPLLNYSDAYRDMKETCQNFLESVLKNIKDELFISNESNLYDAADDDYDSDFDTDALFDELKVQIDNNNELKDDNEDCVIRTDEKYLDIIKKIENNMLLETKRRLKVKRVEVIEKVALGEDNMSHKTEKNKGSNEVIKSNIIKHQLDKRIKDSGDNNKKKKKKGKYKKTHKDNSVSKSPSIIIYLSKKTIRDKEGHHKAKTNKNQLSDNNNKKPIIKKKTKIKEEKTNGNNNGDNIININQTRVLRSLHLKNISSLYNSLQHKQPKDNA